MKIVKGNLSHIDSLTPLFDAYRQFYKQESNLDESRSFLEKRLKQKDSIIFLAEEGSSGLGFCQLYPTFSSVTIQAFYILNDLFVSPNYRGKKIGEALLKHAQNFVKKSAYKGLELSTANDNPAQKLYEKLGWKKDTDYLHYFWTNNDI